MTININNWQNITKEALLTDMVGKNRLHTRTRVVCGLITKMMKIILTKINFNNK